MENDAMGAYDHLVNNPFLMTSVLLHASVMPETITSTRLKNI